MASASTPTRSVDAFATLRERYRASIGETLYRLQSLARRLSVAPGAPDVVLALRREVHRVHGTAGTYGFADASRLAGKLEARLVRWAEDPEADRPHRAAIVEHFVAALRMSVDEDDAAALLAAARRMLLVGVPAPFAGPLDADAPAHGYRASSLAAGDCTVDRVREHAPHVVVTMLEHLDRVAAAAAEAAVPVIALDARTPEERLTTASSAVGERAVVAPAGDAAGAFAVADRLTVRSSWDGATVLVLDDDPSILAIVRRLLERAGVRTVAIEDPAALLDALHTERPALLLIDVHLEDRNGLALARALRETPRFRELPIIVFSTESSPTLRDDVYRAGADEFLAKPIVPAELCGRVVARLERERLRRLAAGLHPGTGLPLGARTARDAAATLAAVRRDGRGGAVVAIRPDGADPEPQRAAAWLRETRRLALALEGPGTFVGYADGVSLLAVLDADADAAESLLEALARARPAEAPAWRAGIVEAAGEPGGDWPALRAAAEQALDAARREDGRLVLRWSRERGDAAPDVVVVEDDPALSEMLQYALRAAGHSCRAFASGPQALEALLRMPTGGRRPLVLLDVDLPGLDGHSLHDVLRLERPNAFAVVFATVHGSEGEQIRAFKAGAIDFVVKPLSLRVLLAKVPVWLERARAAA